MNNPPPWAWNALACVYVIGAALSFGHASNNCVGEYVVNPAGYRYETGVYPIKVVGATVLWPLYATHLAFRTSESTHADKEMP